MQLFLASGRTLQYIFAATIILYVFLYMRFGGLSQKYLIWQGLTGDLRVRPLLVGVLSLECLYGMFFLAFTCKDAMTDLLGEAFQCLRLPATDRAKSSLKLSRSRYRARVLTCI